MVITVAGWEDFPKCKPTQATNPANVSSLGEKTMKRFRSGLCATALTLLISSAALAGDIGTPSAMAPEDIGTPSAPSALKTPGDIGTPSAFKAPGDIGTPLVEYLLFWFSIG
jgi:hypothetical protein